MHWILFVFALVGIANCFYIWHTKHTKRRFVCLVGHSCNEVLNSSHSITLGIPNEFLGALFYLGIAIVAMAPNLPWFADQTPWLYPTAYVAAVIAVWHTFYLIYLQAFVLKQWCDYCLIAAAINLIIFVQLASAF